MPDKQGDAVVISGISSGGDQYKPGFGFGDPNHNHSGPPGLKKKGGAFAPPLTPQIKGGNAIISTNFTIDEQAHLFIHVIDTTTGKELNIEQSSSKVGNKLKGGASKTVNYLVLVPRTIPIKIAVPANLLIPGHKYAVVIDAKDPQGNKSKLKIAFNA